MEASPNTPSPVVRGAKAISRVIGCTPAAAYHMLEGNMLPARKHAGRWTAVREDLIAHFKVSRDDFGSEVTGLSGPPA